MTAKHAIGLLARIGALFLVVTTAGQLPVEGLSRSSHILKEVGDDYWRFKLREHPTYATFRGVHDYDDQLEEFSHASFDRRRDDVTALLSRLDAIDEGELTHTERQNLLVLKADLSSFVDGYPWRRHGNLNPISFLEGIHRTPSWVSSMRYEDEDDFQKYHSRLRAIPTQINQIMELMKEAIQLNRTNHMASMETVPKQMQDAMDIPYNTSLWYSPYGDDLNFAFIADDVRDQIKAEGRDLLLNTVRPAFIKLKNFVENEYMQHTRSGFGVGSWDNGLEFYQACLRFHLSVNVTAQEVREIGLREVARIKGLMEQIMEREGFKGNLSDFFSYLREHKRSAYYDKTGDQLLEKYRTIIYDRINPKIPKILHVENIPTSHIDVRPMPIDGPSGSYGHGTFYANLRRPGNRPTFTMMALTLHEANPGHHLQTSYANGQDLPEFRRHLWSTKYYAVPFNFPWHTAYTEAEYELRSALPEYRRFDPTHFNQVPYTQPFFTAYVEASYTESQDWPEYRRYIADSRYSDVPFTFPWYTAITEGWGLYAEYLGEEMGCYNTSALELFGRYSSEMFRACRLVIDTGIHAFGMTFDEAAEYMAHHTAISTSQIRTEIRRYITWPGQACAYKMGELEILRLRQRAEEQLGDAFDVRDFNDEVLKVGRVPMYVLEKEIENWIKPSTKIIDPFNAGGSVQERHPCAFVTLVFCQLLLLIFIS